MSEEQEDENIVDLFDPACIFSEETILKGELPKPFKPLTYDVITGDLTEESKEIIKKSDEIKYKRLKELGFI